MSFLELKNGSFWLEATTGKWRINILTTKEGPGATKVIGKT